MPKPLKAALRWNLEWGGSREHLEHIAERHGRIPPSLLKEPLLHPHQERLLSFFYLLMPSRPIGMGGVGAIPTADILALAGDSGLDGPEFLHLCRELDAVYIEHLNRKQAT